MKTAMRWLLTPSLLLLLSSCSAQKSEPVAEQPPAETVERYALCAPIPNDQLAAWTAMIEEMKAKADVHKASNKAVGIDQEMIWLQQTPHGSAVNVYFTGRDLGQMMSRRWGAEDEHNRWFVSQIKAIHGLPDDVSQMPVNELVFQGEVAGIEGATQSYMMSAPILPGKEAAHAALCAELAGPRHADWEASRRALGISKEYAWNQKAPDGSTATVVYFELVDLANLSKPAANDFENWFNAQMADIHGMTESTPAPVITMKASF